MKATIGDAVIHGTPEEISEFLAKIATLNGETGIDDACSQPLCPICGIPMEPQVGQFGSFWGCPNYFTQARCRCKRNMDRDRSLKGETIKILKQHRKKTQRDGGVSASEKKSGLSAKRPGFRRRALFQAITKEWQTRKTICREANKILKAWNCKTNFKRNMCDLRDMIFTLEEAGVIVVLRSKVKLI